MYQDRCPVDALAYVSDLRRHSLLRLVAQPACQRARASRGASGDRVGRARRAVAVLLPGRRVRRILSEGLMAIQVRKGQGDVALTRAEFERRFRARFYDPAFEKVDREISEILEVAWQAYDEYHKSPRTRKAGPEFADPDFELPIE